MFSNLEKVCCCLSVPFVKLRLNQSEYRVGSISNPLNGGKRNKEAHAQSSLDFTKQCDQREKPVGQESVFFLQLSVSKKINIILGRNHLTKYVY